MLTSLPRQAVALAVIFASATSSLLANPSKLVRRTNWTFAAITKEYTIAPNRGKPGTYEVLVRSADTKGCEAGSGELNEAKLEGPRGSGVSVETTRSEKCSLTATITVASDVSAGTITLWILSKNGSTLLGTTEFTVTEAVLPGQIPVPEPQVDVMWNVLPKKLVKHNFGNAIANNYYAIEVIIGNNSAYNLQIVSVGFEVPAENEVRRIIAQVERDAGLVRKQGDAKRAAPGDSDQKVDTYEDLVEKPADLDGQRYADGRTTIIPTSSYKITRGSLEARHLLYPRTFVLSTITALGPVLTGFIPFFHNVSHRANFSEGINIFSNPLEKGLEFVWPDPRPGQRDRFDDQVLRDGMLIRNNTQARTLAFFPKEMLKLPNEQGKTYKAWRDVPYVVRQRLGRLVIIGDLIQHVNRISLSPDKSLEGVEAPPVLSASSITSAKQGTAAVPITVHGTNLKGGILSVTGTSGVEIIDQKVDENGKSISGTLKVDKAVAPGNYQLLVTTPSFRGHDSRPFRITPEQFKADTITSDPKQPTVDATKDQEIEIEIVGSFLHNVELKGQGPDISIEPEMVKHSPDGKKVTATVVLKKSANADTYKIVVSDPLNEGSTPKTLEIVVK